jgi:hypothetical protein
MGEDRTWARERAARCPVTGVRVGLTAQARTEGIGVGVARGERGRGGRVTTDRTLQGTRSRGGTIRPLGLPSGGRCDAFNFAVIVRALLLHGSGDRTARHGRARGDHHQDGQHSARARGKQEQRHRSTIGHDVTDVHPG